MITTNTQSNESLVKVDPSTLGIRDPATVAKSWIDSMTSPVGIMFWYESGNEDHITKRCIVDNYEDVLEFGKTVQSESTFIGWPERCVGSN